MFSKFDYGNETLYGMISDATCCLTARHRCARVVKNCRERIFVPWDLRSGHDDGGGGGGGAVLSFETVVAL